MSGVRGRGVMERNDSRWTREEALRQALNWAEGRLSHLNEMMAMENSHGDGEVDRQKTLVATAQADAAEVAKWAALASALPGERE